MINSIRVDGFRSLIQFSIDLQPGLNVIVGPNGTGKSNFISFLDFLNAFIQDDLNSAIAVAQGAGSVFSKEAFSAEEASLSFRISGSWERDPNRRMILMSLEEDKSTSGNYDYECELRYAKAIPAVYIHREQLRVASDKSPLLRVVRTTNRIDQQFKNNVSVDWGNKKTLKQRLKWIAPMDDKISAEQYFERILSPDLSIINHLTHLSAGMSYLAGDLTGYRSVNIDPTLARKSTPVGSNIQVSPSGEGLAGALYHIKRGTYFGGHRYPFEYREPSKTRMPSFKSIESWCREINSNIRSLDVTLEFMEAQFIPIVEFDFGDRKEGFSFARISDGTVKWLSLVTIILAEPRLNLIEEPENFLHPFMQEAFISLCRDVISQEPRRILILSTHSPTLLDCCEPSELTMFELHSGRTRATKVANRVELEEKIISSRFRLGHYYKIGALYGEDSSTS